ncbi:hypothetical protein HELRODRAFT_190041 [Helobdella robusta]|uniref:RGS domain-containing protein n=1 Tax=Helobdella robusta TaxID=6412 RepID=T1FRM3_HELRO|nr:hypothetical protein HELRODRAFT_190041 [Helobdella robusta]ESO11647.1 hypothetical protein HELRODRAFT_190041 [Helobdella robusta]
MIFSNIFRKKPHEKEEYSKSKKNEVGDVRTKSMGVNQSREKSNISPHKNGLNKESPLKKENKMDDISVHLAVSKYASNLSQKSQLYKSLLETLMDKSALSYFMQFMEFKFKCNLLKFWIDVHNFKLSSSMVSKVALCHSNGGASYANHVTPSTAATTSATTTNIPNSVSLPILSSTTSASFPTTTSPLSSSHSSSNTQMILNACILYDDIEKEQQREMMMMMSSTRRRSIEQSVISNSFQLDGSDLENDALFIFTRYLTGDTRHKIDVPTCLQQLVAQRFSCLEQQELRADCFDECHNYVFDLLQKEYHPEYLQSSFHYKHQLDILTSNNLIILDILYHETSLSYFTEFMEQEQAMDYLQCFLDVDNYHHHHQHLQRCHQQHFSPAEKQNDINNNQQRHHHKQQQNCCQQKQQKHTQQQKLTHRANNIHQHSPNTLSTSSSFNNSTLTHHSISSSSSKSSSPSQLQLPQASSSLPATSSSSSSPFRPNVHSQLAQDDAMVIYEKFFSLQASRPLNFSDGIRLELESSICSVGGVQYDCFLLPRSLLLYKMEQVHFPMFLKSDVFYKYLAELINSIHNSNNILGYSRRRQNSNGSLHSSETTTSNNSSITSKNTLLAVDTLSKQYPSVKKGRRKSKEKMNIDGIILDPDHIWQRPCTSMKLGHVNDLGEFIPEFDPNPVSDKKSFFSLTAKSKRSREEEAALLIAQQIIQDVNILTCTNNNTTVTNNNSNISTDDDDDDNNEYDNNGDGGGDNSGDGETKFTAGDDSDDRCN